MREWHLTPEYILEKMTDEEWEMYWKNRNHYMLEMNRSADAPAPAVTPASAPAATRRVSDQEMFHSMGIAQGSA